MSDLELPACGDPWVRNKSPGRRGRLERRSAVRCEACGAESCECWRCTCEPRSARPSPARLAPRPPARALSDDSAAERPRRLYKSSSQRLLGTTSTIDPLLETTC
ncbi:uncharacterized protein LOC114246326 [Bombyx mandarina]|uniref:Uncharacterized protein LOC114246326 n=1 Tax=Bombyx mandarina TaxID=7092 RepID=A0A6J2JYV2_BOMMA|nr:uncharacterized protein LOC114246326 [Bombyx mandarina]